MLKKADIGVGLYLLCAVVFFIIPIPSFLLDIMLAINISIALLLLSFLSSEVLSFLLLFEFLLSSHFLLLLLSALP